ncbi:hypothetical protein NG798_23860 [Ancylothrix sp. C2]|uniref:hypothetical protein n=1 Tax=Ancylothrix sp. D3o TaxID=2953691 RepID=UPI0021BADA2F|nr:hypothetical protein [Ancylothrix sp. D3o]MCT7952841.1 hypothetical protein [Ancylothrix sp. D3o]
MPRPLEYTTLQINTAVQIEERRKTISKAQEKIFRFWLDIVHKDDPEDVLLEFNKLFFHHVTTRNPEIIQALYEIIIAENEEEFFNTLKRSCYILVNNWAGERKQQAIQKLVQEVLVDPAGETYTSSMTLNRLREWMLNFSKSQDYEELKLFIARYETTNEETHWSERYTSYLLVQQYTNLKNSPEHREAAKIRAQQIKERFKFDLAMYTARCNGRAYSKPLNLASSEETDTPKNPSSLGDEVLQLIKLIVAKRGQFSYSSLANIFIQQTQDLRYEDFKQSLQKYLIYSVDTKECVEALKIKLSKKLKPLYQDYNDQPLTDALILRTCKRVVEFLTTERQNSPSSLFVLLLSQGHPLTLVIILLKLTMICKAVRPHLEASLAALIQYYMDYPESECQWVINFLEILKITFVIYDDNVRYNLLKTEDNKPLDLDSYRIFSQQTSRVKEEKSTDDYSEDIAIAEDSYVPDSQPTSGLLYTGITAEDTTVGELGTTDSQELTPEELEMMDRIEAESEIANPFGDIDFQLSNFDNFKAQPNKIKAK